MIRERVCFWNRKRERIPLRDKRYEEVVYTKDGRNAGVNTRRIREYENTEGDGADIMECEGEIKDQMDWRKEWRI